MTIALPEDVFINALRKSIRWDTSHTNSSRHFTEELTVYRKMQTATIKRRHRHAILTFSWLLATAMNAAR